MMTTLTHQQPIPYCGLAIYAVDRTGKLSMRHVANLTTVIWWLLSLSRFVGAIRREALIWRRAGVLGMVDWWAGWQRDLALIWWALMGNKYAFQAVSYGTA